MSAHHWQSGVASNDAQKRRQMGMLQQPAVGTAGRRHGGQPAHWPHPLVAHTLAGSAHVTQCSITRATVCAIMTEVPATEELLCVSQPRRRSRRQDDALRRFRSACADGSAAPWREHAMSYHHAPRRAAGRRCRQPKPPRSCSTSTHICSQRYRSVDGHHDASEQRQARRQTWSEVKCTRSPAADSAGSERADCLRSSYARAISTAPRAAACVNTCRRAAFGRAVI